MTHSNTSITILNCILSQSKDGNPHTIEVPHGEAAYWARRIYDLHEGQRFYIHFPAETSHLPYLGHIACPNDELAKHWLLVQHVRVVTQ